MTSRDSGMQGEYVFRRQGDGALHVRLRLFGVERDLQLADRETEPRDASPSAMVNATNLGLAIDLLLDLTGSALVAVQVGERLARKLAVTFAARPSIDGLVIAREAIWRWLRWALTHPAAPVAEQPLVRQRSADLPPPYLGGGHWWWSLRRQPPPNPLRWERLTLAATDEAENLTRRRSGREN